MSGNSTDYQLVVCIRNDGHPVDLDLRKIYRSVPDRQAQRHGLIRVIDESGEDYLFPADYFVAIRASSRLREALPFERENGRRAKRRAAASSRKPASVPRQR